MRHSYKHNTAFLPSIWLEKITNRTYVGKSQYVKHGWGYCDSVYIVNDRPDHRNKTKKHRLKSYNLTSLFEVTQ